MDLPRIRGKEFIRNVPAIAGGLFAVFLASLALASESPQPWPARPLMNGEWQYASQEQVASLIQKFRNHVSHEQRSLIEGITRLRALPLSCHQDVILFEGEARHSSGQVGVVSFLLHTKGITLLDGKADRIYALNVWNPAKIGTEEQAQTYLKLFTGSLTSEEGNFRILQTSEEVVWQDETVKNSHRDLIQKVKPLELRPDGDSWRGSGVVQYGKHLFISTFVLGPNGKVEMADDDPIGSALPIVVTRYIGVLRYETL